METVETNPVPVGAAGRLLLAAWEKAGHLWRSQGKRRALVVKETASLGERRFVAVVQFERQRFLVGASPGSVALLAQLPDAESPEGERA
jgi:flagellar biogenesis protein FliO